MMYSEFVAGTGCKQTEKNYEIFKELEIIYMNSNCTKEHIYEMGRKLVDNSKTEEQLRIEEEVNEEIARINKEIKFHEGEIERMEWLLSVEGSEHYKKIYWSNIKKNKDFIRVYKSYINALKWVLEG